MNDKKAKHLIADKEKVWVFWVDETRNNILLSQSLIQNKALTAFNSMTF